MLKEVYWKIEPALKKPASRIYEKRAIEAIRTGMRQELEENLDMIQLERGTLDEAGFYGLPYDGHEPSEDEIIASLRYAESLGITSREFVEHGYWRYPASVLEKIRNERGSRWRVAAGLVGGFVPKNRRIFSIRKNPEAMAMEREMLEARFRYEVRNSEFGVMGWHEMRPEMRERMLTKMHSRMLNHKYRRPGAIMDGTRSKVLFAEHFDDMLGRRWFENKELSFEEFAAKVAEFRTDAMFHKPVFGSTGTEVRKFMLPAGRKGQDRGATHGRDAAMDREGLMEIYKEIRDVHGIAEECIEQHEDMNGLCPDCVNTVRMGSLVDFDGQVHILWGTCRIGCGDGQPIDNASKGGLRVSVDLVSGIFDSMAVDGSGDLLEKHPTSGAVFMGFKVPYWQEVLGLVEKAALRAESDFGLGYVGWDIAITPEGPVLVEGNNCPAVATIQYPWLIQYGKGMKWIVEEWL